MCVCVCVCVCVHVCIPYYPWPMINGGPIITPMALTCRGLSSKTACGSLVKMTFTAIGIHECAAQLLQSNTNVVIYIYHAKRTLKGSDIVHKSVQVCIELQPQPTHMHVHVKHDASFYARSSEENNPGCKG